MDIRGLLMDLLMDLDHFEVATNVVKPLRLPVGLTRIELVTSSLSGMRSNQLSYSPQWNSDSMVTKSMTQLVGKMPW